MSSFARSISAASLGSGDRDGSDLHSRLGSSPALGRSHPSGAPLRCAPHLLASRRTGMSSACPNDTAWVDDEPVLM